METVTRPDGRTLAYEEYGDPDGPPVVFCHGTPGSRLSGGVFDDQPLRVVALDRPGIGGSDPAPRGYPDPGRTLRAWRDDVEAVTRALGIGSFGVLGFSGGTPFALAAGSAPGATGVALVAPFGPLETRSADGFTLLARRAPILLRGLFAVQRRVVRRRPESALSLYTDADPSSLSLPEGVDPVERFAEDYLAATAQGGRWPARETALFAGSWELPNPEVPVGVWYGENDENVPPSTAGAVAAGVADETTALSTDHLETLCESRPDCASFLSPSA